VAVLSNRSATAGGRRSTKDALVAATLALLDGGTAFADISIEQIVRTAGLSRPTFYTYFRDKRELILHLGEAVERDVAAAAGPWLAAPGGDARDTLAGVLGVFRLHAEAVGAITEAATYDAEVAEFWRGFHERFLPGAQERIRAGAPELDDAAVVARAHALVWMTEVTLTQHVARPTVDEGALLDQVTFLWRAATGQLG
jgi:TetR/AcrR family transcriptional regulator, ethionamide resistance regulator